MPSCASRLASVWLTTDWERLSLRPAAEKLPSSAAARKVRIWSSDKASSMAIYRLCRWVISRNIGYLYRSVIPSYVPSHSTEAQDMKLLHIDSSILGEGSVSRR